jgi:transposase
MKRRAYRATEVKDVRLEEVMRSAPAGAATAGLDIGKYEILAVVRWKEGSFERPWKAQNPLEIEMLVGLLRDVADRGPLRVAMESTGTYGDALRAKLDQAGLEVHRVGGKAAHDYAEVFDGVPSQHDGKDAAVVAELAAIGKSVPWPYRAKSAWDAELASWADWLDAQQSIQQLWTGRLESRLARHWPEATRLLDLSSVTLLRALAHYGGPADLAKDPRASARLASWGRHVLKREKIEKVIAAAAQTVGVRQGSQDIQRMQQYATMALYFAAMRTAQSVFVKPWFEAKKGKDKDRSKGALIAVARKLALALHAVGAQGKPFESWRLFSQKVLVQKAQRAKRRAARSHENSGRGVFSAMGAPPPNPRDLPPDANPGDKKDERGRTDPPPSPVLAPGSALGSVPTVALSSAQVKRV